jgi:hypothetical protein
VRGRGLNVNGESTQRNGWLGRARAAATREQESWIGGECYTSRDGEEEGRGEQGKTAGKPMHGLLPARMGGARSLDLSMAPAGWRSG